MKQKISNSTTILQQQIGKLSWIGVKKFLVECQKQEKFNINKVHSKKLCNLGLHEGDITDSIHVIKNFSDHLLTTEEISALNKGLNFSIVPLHFNFLQIQASLERIYHETRPYLDFKNRLEFKRLIFNMYSKYKSGYFHAKNRNNSI